VLAQGGAWSPTLSLAPDAEPSRGDRVHASTPTPEAALGTESCPLFKVR